MSNPLKILLENYLEMEEYSKYNELLRQEIISKFVKKVQAKDSYFLYSSMVELLESIEKILSEKEISDFRYFYDLLKKDYSEKELSEILTEFYKNTIK